MVDKYRSFARLYPKKMRESYFRLLQYADLKVQPDRFIGFILIIGIGVGLLAAFNLAIFTSLNIVLLWLISFIVFEAAVYFWLMMKIDGKAKAVEKVLPDALLLMSSNLKAGLTIDKALLLAARPEFGLFQKEIHQVGQEITVGQDVGQSLMNMTKRISSEKLKKAIMLIVEGIRAGGKLSSLLEQTARNLRNKEVLEDNVRSNVMSYVIFIFASISFGTPLLFGLSSFLIEVLKNIIGSIALPETSTTAMPINITPVGIDPGFVILYAISSITMISFMGALIIGLISRGKEKYGLKFIPLLLIITFAMFFMIRAGLEGMLGGLFDF